MESDLTIEKGWSGGEESRSETNKIGNYEKKFNITYNRLQSEYFSLTVHGSFETYTKASGKNNKAKIVLTKKESDNNHIIYTGEQYSSGTIGWRNQKARIVITVEIKSNADVTVTNYVSAGAWGTISYAHATSKISLLKLGI